VDSVSTDKNYYKDLWNDPRTEAGQFFNKVDFNSKGYQLQEHVFKQCLWSINNLRKWDNREPISTVLEVGVGTGRMTKIVLEELPSIKMYDMLDIKPLNEQKIKENLSSIPKEVLKGKELNSCYPMDITKGCFSQTFHPDVVRYDMVLASEVFMHIKPSDLEKTMKRLIDILAPEHGIIINIDWVGEPMPSDWCFIHNYDQIYRDNGLQPIITSNIETINQKLFCYGK